MRKETHKIMLSDPDNVIKENIGFFFYLQNVRLRRNIIGKSISILKLM